MVLGRRLNVLLDMGDFVFYLLLFWGAKGGRRGGGGFLTHTASQPSLWAGLSLPYTTLLRRFFHFLSAKCLLFSIPRRFVCRLGGLVVGKGQDRAGQGMAGHRAGQGIGQGRAKRRVFFFSFFSLSLLPYFLFFSKGISFQREEERFFFFVWVGSFTFSLFPSIEKKVVRGIGI